MKRFQPALLGGLFIGVLSSLPIVSAGNLCCCLWVVSGGVLTAYLIQQGTPEPIQTSEAAIGGLVAGLVGAVVSVLISQILLAITGPLWQQSFQEGMRRAFEQNQDMPPELRDRIQGLVSRMASGPGLALVQLAVVLPVYAIFGLLGGLLGTAFFKKKLPPAAPPASPPLTPTM